MSPVYIHTRMNTIAGGIPWRLSACTNSVHQALFLLPLLWERGYVYLWPTEQKPRRSSKYWIRVWGNFYPYRSFSSLTPEGYYTNVSQEACNVAYWIMKPCFAWTHSQVTEIWEHVTMASGFVYRHTHNVSPCLYYCCLSHCCLCLPFYKNTCKFYLTW